MDIQSNNLLNELKAICPEIEVNKHRNQTTLLVPAGKLKEVASFLRDNPTTKFDMLVDITAIDWLKSDMRYDVIYFLSSTQFHSRVRLKVKAKSDKPIVPSVASVWESADWYERETFDMYGINFEGHPKLRRFYMPEDFNDPISGEAIHPLRKDFPLMGIPDALPLPPYPEKFGEVK